VVEFKLGGPLMTVDLNSRQQTSLSQGEAVLVDVDHTECVLVRKDVFERLQRAAAGELTSEEMIAAASLAFDDADACGPIP
jgi:hypothetical protein